jgi:hypothetical protein
MMRSVWSSFVVVGVIIIILLNSQSKLKMFILFFSIPSCCFSSSHFYWVWLEYIFFYFPSTNYHFVCLVRYASFHCYFTFLFLAILTSSYVSLCVKNLINIPLTKGKIFICIQITSRFSSSARDCVVRLIFLKLSVARYSQQSSESPSSSYSQFFFFSFYPPTPLPHSRRLQLRLLLSLFYLVLWDF